MTHRLPEGSPTTLSRWLAAGAAALVCWSGLPAAAAPPTLAYSTLVGGTGVEFPFAIAVDANQEAVITGQADATYPTTPGAHLRTGGGIFVTRLNASGTALVYSTFLGPGRGTGVALHGGHAYVTGRTSVSFATPGAVNHFDPSGSNGFVAKLKPDGSGIVWAAFFGRVSEDPHIALDAAGNVYVSGTTSSPSFPVTMGAFQSTRPTLPAITGDSDAFFLKLDSTGSTLLYATYLASDQLDQATGIAVDAAGMAYVSGYTEGRAGAWLTFPAATVPFPTTASAFRTTFTGTQSAFVAKFDPNQSGAASLVYSTLLGNQGLHQAHGIAVDAAGNAYVSGRAESNFPLTAGSYGVATLQAPGTFVTKLNAAGGALVYSAMIPAGSGGRIAIDASNNAFVGGGIMSSPVFVPLNPLPGITGEGFLAKLDATGSIAEYATHMQGRGVMALAVDPAGAAYALGDVHQTAFIASPGAYQSALNNNFPDLFVAKVATNQPPVADAGNDQSIFLGQSFTLDGSGSSDPEGQALSYVWRDAGNNVIGTVSTLSRGPLTQGEHVFTLRVSDGLLSDADAVRVTAHAVLSMNFYGANSGAGSGRVVSGDGRIDCHSSTNPCNTSYAQPAAVTLTATADTGSVFLGWVLECSGAGFCTHTVDRNIYEGARFGIQQLTLTVPTPANGKVLSLSHAAINCGGAACSVDVAYGTEVVLEAWPDAGYEFAGWSANCIANGTTCRVTLQQSQSVTATFREITLTGISISPANGTAAVGVPHQFTVVGTFSDGKTRVLSADHSIEASDNETCFVTRSGIVKCWGANTALARKEGYNGAIALAAGSSHTCAILSDGSVTCENQAIAGVQGAVAIAASAFTTCAVVAGGVVQCWGGQLPPFGAATTTTFAGTQAPSIVPIDVGAEGGPGLCALLSSGAVSCLGGTSTVAGISNAVAVSTGVHHACALLADGRVKCWGDNDQGQLGRGTIDPGNLGSWLQPPDFVVESSSGTNIPITNAIGIMLGDYHGCALMQDTTVKCWGQQYTSGSTAPISPLALTILKSVGSNTTALTGVAGVAAGAFHTCAAMLDGTANCWGLNLLNILGSAATVGGTEKAVAAAGVSNAVAISWRVQSLGVRIMASGRAIASSAGAKTVTAAIGGFTASATMNVVNTATGTNVSVTPVVAATGTSPVTVTFSNVTQAGETTVVINPGAPPGIPTTLFQLGTPSVYYDISTTATYTPPITICIGYAGISFTGSPKLFHFEGGAWVDVTTSFDTTLQRVCGQVSSLSPFALMVPANAAPVARAGPDQTLECSAPQTLVTLDGSASSDANLDPLTFSWTGNFGTKSGAVATVNLPLGLSTASLTVSDGRASSTDTVQVTVRDTAAPDIAAASASPSVLWPPNQKMTAVTVSAAASDRCDAKPRCRIESVTSNEPANGTGDGNSSPDWQITGDLTLLLRAERSGQGNGRTYSINLRCLDASGNGSSRVIPVTVPKNR